MIDIVYTRQQNVKNTKHQQTVGSKDMINKQWSVPCVSYAMINVSFKAKGDFSIKPVVQVGLVFFISKKKNIKS